MSHHREPAWRRYLTFWRPSIDRDLDAELRFHFDERVADLVARGRTEVEARAEAEREFGDRETYRARMREIDRRLEARRNRTEWLDMIRGDVRLAWRGMRRAPGLSAMVVVTLALGIGANGAIFSMLDRLYFRPPPGVAAPGEVRRIYGDAVRDPSQPVFVRRVFGAGEFRNMARAVGSEYQLAGYNMTLTRLGTDDDSPMAEVSDVLGNYFRLLGVRAWKGRVFAEDELTADPAPKVVVLSHRFWRTHFAADSGVIGREIAIVRQKYRVIGIAAPGFDGIDLDAIDMWRPADLSEPGYGPGTAGIRLLTRAPTSEAMLRVVKLASDGYDSGESFTKNTTLRAVPIADGRGSSIAGFIEGDLAKRLAGVTLMVLLIAIANVANLLLTRAIERRREIAIRVSLGVSRARLAAQLVTESAVLALIAGAGALLVALWGASLMRGLLLPDVRWADGPLDWRLGVFTLVIALGAGLVASVLPLVRAGRLDLAGSMRGGARDGSAHSSRTRAALIVAQTALSVVLLAGSLLFVRSLRAVQSVDIGFDPAGVIMAQVYSGQQIVPAPQRQAALVAAGERMHGRPGVLSIATSNLEPMAGLSFAELHFPGRDSLPKTNSGPPTFVAVSPEFFRTVGVSIIAGRPFLPSDVDGTPRVMIVTRTMARVAWGATNPIGQCVKVGPINEPCTTVVGVIEDVRREKVVEDDALLFYLPSAQAPAFARGAGVLIVRAEPAAVDAIEREVRAAILSALPGSRPQMRTFTELLDPDYRPWRVGASLFTAFGLLALLVAAIGVYSGISYSVTQRSHELGVRMALGAPRARIGRNVIGAGVRVAGIGVVTGVVIALALGRLVESLLYQVSPRDPVVLGSVAVMLLGIAAAAAALPAWRATRLDPVRVLRSE